LVQIKERADATKYHAKNASLLQRHDGRVTKTYRFPSPIGATKGCNS